MKRNKKRKRKKYYKKNKKKKYSSSLKIIELYKTDINTLFDIEIESDKYYQDEEKKKK